MILNTHYPYIGGGGGKPNFTYTGNYTEVDDGGGNWRIKFLTSGTLTLKNKIVVDVFLVGGGGGGRSSSNVGGGGGGYTHTTLKMEINPGIYPITIGAGGAANANGSPSTFNNLSANGGSTGREIGDSGYGGNGGSGGGLAGNGGSDGGNGASAYGRGGSGQGTTTREFGESSGDLYAGGGGGSSTSSYQTFTGGAGGGGNGGGGSVGGITAGTPNTGGGGGAGNVGYVAAAGGSGIVIIRNAR